MSLGLLFWEIFNFCRFLILRILNSTLILMRLTNQGIAAEEDDRTRPHRTKEGSIRVLSCEEPARKRRPRLGKGILWILVGNQLFEAWLGFGRTQKKKKSNVSMDHEIFERDGFYWRWTIWRGSRTRFTNLNWWVEGIKCSRMGGILMGMTL